MLKYGHHIINYCDDLIGYGLPSKIHQSFNTLCKILGDLGLIIRETKLVDSSISVVCLGVIINIVKDTISVPPEKLDKIKVICVKWSVKTQTNKRQLQSLLGSLLYVTKCVRNARFFLNRKLATFRSATDPPNIKLDQEFARYGSRNSSPISMVSVYKAINALKALKGDYVYQLSISDSFFGLVMVQLEMLNVYFLPSDYGLQYRLVIKTNFSVKMKWLLQSCSMANKKSCSDCYSRNFRMLAACFDIELFVIHILGIQNSMADSML